MKKLCLSIGFVLVGTASLAFGGDKPNIKPGLWEVTFQMSMAGAPNMPARTDKSCVTAKQLERGVQPPSNPHSACKVVSTSFSGSTQETHMQCDGGRMQGTGVLKISFPSPTQYSGEMTMNMETAGHQMSMVTHLSGKWLSADCGNVKPIEIPDGK